MKLIINRKLTSLLFCLSAGVCGCVAPDQDSNLPEAPAAGSSKGVSDLNQRLEAIGQKPHDAPINKPQNQPSIPGPGIARQSPPLQQPEPPKSNDPIDLSNSRATVQIFVTDWSDYCKQLEEFLVVNKIKYIKYDVGHDISAKSYAYRLSGAYSVPVTLVGKEVILGFDLPAIKAAIRKYTPKTQTAMKGYTF